MKKIFLILPFILIACAQSDVATKPIPTATETQKEAIRLTYTIEQKLKIQDTEVFVKMAIVEQGPFEKQNWVLITTPRQTLSYVAYDLNQNYSIKQNLTSDQLTLLKNAPVQNYTEVDLDIPLFVEMYHILNTLELSRCRSAKIWKDLVKFIFSKRQTIYFNAAYSLSSPWALAWDMDSQMFKGVVATSSNYTLDKYYHKKILALLTPQQNIYGIDEKLLGDSRFISLSAFRSRCDFGYSFNSFDKPDQDFAPRYDESNDRSISKIVDMDFDGATLATNPIYFFNPSFTEDDIDYAKKLNILDL